MAEEYTGFTTNASGHNLTDYRANWPTMKFGDLDHYIKIISGKGVGQVRLIIANNNTTLRVAARWNTIPDATSEYEILK